jgi:hypothetical protein
MVFSAAYEDILVAWHCAGDKKKARCFHRAFLVKFVTGKKRTPKLSGSLD